MPEPLEMCLRGKSGKISRLYMVTEMRIEVNPAKVSAIQDLKPPTNLKEAQVLAGKIVSLSCFISQMADKSLLFFKIL